MKPTATASMFNAGSPFWILLPLGGTATTLVSLLALIPVFGVGAAMMA
jgi:hypothetical protein